jgi:hypothetical protein
MTRASPAGLSATAPSFASLQEALDAIARALERGDAELAAEVAGRVAVIVAALHETADVVVRDRTEWLRVQASHAAASDGARAFALALDARASREARSDRARRGYRAHDAHHIR